MTIRTITSKDNVEWMRMRRALWPSCSEERHKLETEQFGGSQDPGVILVADAEHGSLCGFMELSIRHDHVDGTSSSPVAYVEGWYVDPDFRGRGIGRTLLDRAEQWARSHGFRELASDATLDNAHGISAHLSCGFRETGRSVHFIKRLAQRFAPISVH